MPIQGISSLSKADLNGKTVLVRVDFNVPIHDGVITDDSRIKAALPTLKDLLQHGARCVVVSHLGRPKGKVDPALSLACVGKHLATLLDVPCKMMAGCIEEEVVSGIQADSDSRVFLLENIRFYAEETTNDAGFSRQLAGLADIFVQDAFGAVHRAHASTVGVANFLPSYAGLLVEKELHYLSGALKQPQRPFVAIVGGAKVSSKIAVLSHLLDVVDTLIIGGGMAFTFLKAQGLEVGTSLVEQDQCDVALQLLEKAKQLGKQIVLPRDVIVSAEFGQGPDAAIETVLADAIPKHKMGLDIGPLTLEAIEGVLQGVKTVVWNGPMGVFEMDAFAQGTLKVARFLASSNGTIIVGGGDSVAAINQSGLAEQFDHISTGGGACLEYLEGKVLPGIACLDKTL